jgi:hypothetical protein
MSTTRSSNVANPTDSKSRPTLQESSLAVAAGRRTRKRRIAAAIVLTVAFVAAVGLWFLAAHAYSQRAVIRDLKVATGTEVGIKNFKAMYLPHPGCVLENVTFVQNRGATAQPLITIQKLTIVGSYLGLLSHRVSSIHADGMHLIVPPLGTGPALSHKKSDTVVGQFVTENAVLEFARRDATQPPLKFEMHRFVIHNLGSDRSMSFETSLSNPEPKGEIHANGKFGPWREGQAEQTPVEGNYTFQRADLGSIPGIAGVLSSQGKFSGTFKRLSVDGATDTPDFEVKNSEHRTHLTTSFHAIVDATSGDVDLRDVHAHFWNTSLQAQGTVDGKHGGNGKTALVEFVGREGRIEDLMMLFIHEKKSPIAGVISFGARTMLPPKDGPFLKKIELEGDFGIGAAHFTNPESQKNVTELSQKARGQADKLEDGDLPPERILSDLKGHVVLKNGTATFSRLTFTVPGANAEMEGTYDLISERVDLRGTLHMVAKLSKATTGVKSFLIKIINPFTNKDRPKKPIHFRITGTYGKPDYSVSP